MTTNLNDFDFVSKHRPESLEIAKKWLDGIKPVTQACSFAIFSPTGKILREEQNGVCHAGISADLDNVDLVATSLSNQTCEGVPEYLDWLIYHSFASRFILHHGEKGIVVSSDIPTYLLQNIMIATRHPQEFVAGMPKFGELVRKGFNPDIVYNFVFGTTFIKAGGVNGPSFIADENDPISSYGWHRAWDLFNLESLRNFLNRNFINKQTGSDLTARHYRKTQSTYGGKQYCVVGQDYSLFDDLFKKETFKQALREYRNQGQSGEIYRPPNPFVKKQGSVLRADQVSVKEFFEVVLPFVQNEVGVV